MDNRYENTADLRASLGIETPSDKAFSQTFEAELETDQVNLKAKFEDFESKMKTYEVRNG